MSEDKTLVSTIVTPEFVMAFPNLFEAKPFMRNGKPKGEPVFGMTMLFAAADVQVLKDKAAEVARARWPGRAFGELKFPFKDGNAEAAKAKANKKDGSFYEGKVVVKTSSKFQPQVVDENKNPILDKSKIYSGVYGFAELNFVAYDGVDGGKDGVKAYVNFVMKSRDGKRIAGKDAASVFAGIKGGKSDKDPTAGDDDIPM